MKLARQGKKGMSDFCIGTGSIFMLFRGVKIYSQSVGDKEWFTLQLPILQRNVQNWGTEMVKDYWTGCYCKNQTRFWHIFYMTSPISRVDS